MSKIIKKIDMYGRCVDVIDIYLLVFDGFGWFENGRHWVDPVLNATGRACKT